MTFTLIKNCVSQPEQKVFALSRGGYICTILIFQTCTVRYVQTLAK
jgi:hypothetical protein